MRHAAHRRRSTIEKQQRREFEEPPSSKEAARTQRILEMRKPHLVSVNRLMNGRAAGHHNSGKKEIKGGGCVRYISQGVKRAAWGG